MSAISARTSSRSLAVERRVLGAVRADLRQPGTPFSDRVMNRHAFGTEWTAAQLTEPRRALHLHSCRRCSRGCGRGLSARGKNPSTPAKFGWALVLAGGATAVLAYAASHPGADGLAGVWSLALAYFVLTVGEMMLSPIGLSAVTTLSVTRVVSLMMGTWFLASAFGEILAGRFGTLAAVAAGCEHGRCARRLRRAVHPTRVDRRRHRRRVPPAQPHAAPPHARRALMAGQPRGGVQATATLIAPPVMSEYVYAPMRPFTVSYVKSSGSTR